MTRVHGGMVGGMVISDGSGVQLNPPPPTHTKKNTSMYITVGNPLILPALDVIAIHHSTLLLLLLLLQAIDRRERLRRLAMETIDLSKDPYFMKNHLGQYECRLCLTLHKNEGNYLAHTQGKRHQQNIAKRAAREKSEKPIAPAPIKRAPAKKTVKIGRPGYKVTKQFDPSTSTRSLLFQIEYPEIEEDTRPRHRFMSSIEQKKEPTNWKYQYLLFAADPYETIAFKVPNWEVDKNATRGGVKGGPELLFNHWDPDGKVYTLQVPFKKAERRTLAPPPPRAPVGQNRTLQRGPGPMPGVAGPMMGGIPAMSGPSGMPFAMQQQGMAPHGGMRYGVPPPPVAMPVSQLGHTVSGSGMPPPPPRPPLQ